MKLPGGLLLDGKLCHDITFKPITGELERVICESCCQYGSLVEQVTAILTHTIDRVANVVADKFLILKLSSGDRHFLVQQLEAILYPHPKWLTVNCNDCNELIQLQLQPGALPVKPANNCFPKTSVTLSIGTVETRVPTGADEQAISEQSDSSKNLLNQLLHRIVTRSNEAIDIEKLTDDDLALLDKTVEDMMPQVGDAIATLCPYCNKEQQVSIDIYEWISGSSYNLDEEIHSIASHYHWSEQEILTLPRYRRKRYLQLINSNLHKTDDYNSIGNGEMR